MGRVGPLPTFATGWGITSAIFHTHRQVHFGYWRAEVALDVGCQCFEWGDIDRMKTGPWGLCQFD